MPAAARTRPDWPIRHDHGFARVILDTVCARPWREVIPAPAWRRMDPATLSAAVALAESILTSRADLASLNAASLILRGKRKGR